MEALISSALAATVLTLCEHGTDGAEAAVVCAAVWWAPSLSRVLTSLSWSVDAVSTWRRPGSGRSAARPSR